MRKAKSSMRQAVFTEKGVTPGGPYSQVVILNGVAYVSSQGPLVPGTSTVPGTFREQAQQVFENVGILLTASGSSFEQVVKVGVFLADLKYFAEMNVRPAPSGNGMMLCTKPFPKLVWPTIIARSWSCIAPATISEAEAV